jgi:hypothetical protein
VRLYTWRRAGLADEVGFDAMPESGCPWHVMASKPRNPPTVISRGVAIGLGSAKPGRNT